MELFAEIASLGDAYVWSFPKALPWIIVVLLGTGFFITARLSFIQLRRIGHAIRVVLGKYDDPNDPGDVSHFQALSTALSATVGIGNIAGVALAIHYGGPGAVFWMWLTAVLGMALKFAECTLAVKYRDFDDRGEVAGGPMYYIEKGLGKNYKVLAIFFALCAVISSFGGGNMNQANTVTVSATTEFGLSPHLVGFILAALVGSAIVFGIRGIARVASALAPSMALLYVAAALMVLIIHAGEIPHALGTIFASAFSPQASMGGSAAGVFSLTLLWGVKRGLFSNEAGQGSAPIAHAAAKTNEPVREGAVAMLGPFIDTLLICTMTALVIVITGVWDKKRDASVPLDKVSFYLPDRGAATSLPAHLAVDESVVMIVSKEGRRVVPMVADALVEEGQIIDESTGKPYGREISLALAESGDHWEAVVPEGVRVEFRGKMLQNSSALTAWAFEEGLAPYGIRRGSLVVTICVFLFALSTMVSWSYYGDRCINYLFGSKYVMGYRVVFVAFVYLGAIWPLKPVWTFGDVALGLMTVPNLVAIILLSPKLVEMTRDYFSRVDGHGE